MLLLLHIFMTVNMNVSVCLCTLHNPPLLSAENRTSIFKNNSYTQYFVFLNSINHFHKQLGAFHNVLNKVDSSGTIFSSGLIHICCLSEDLRHQTGVWWSDTVWTTVSMSVFKDGTFLSVQQCCSLMEHHAAADSDIRLWFSLLIQYHLTFSNNTNVKWWVGVILTSRCCCMSSMLTFDLPGETVHLHLYDFKSKFWCGCGCRVPESRSRNAGQPAHRRTLCSALLRSCLHPLYNTTTFRLKSVKWAVHFSVLYCSHTRVVSALGEQPNPVRNVNWKGLEILKM